MKRSIYSMTLEDNSFEAIYLPVTRNIIVTTFRTSEVGTTLAPFRVGSSSSVLSCTRQLPIHYRIHHFYIEKLTKN